MALIIKYKTELHSFMDSILHPPSEEFCKMLSILTEGGTVEEEPYVDLDRGNPYQIICYVSLAALENSENVCDYEMYGEKATTEWPALCRAGIYIKTKDITLAANASDIFYVGLDIASYGQPYTFLEDFKKELYEEEKNITIFTSSETDGSFEQGREVIRNLQAISFCEKIEDYNEECAKILETK